MCNPPKVELELRTRLETFQRLVEEFEAIVSIVPYEARLTLGGEPTDSELVDHKSRLICLALIRKFVFKGSDWCYLPSLLGGVAETFANIRPEIADEARLGIEDFHKRFNASLVNLQRPDYPPKRAPATVRQLMYGSLLHGDLDKRQSVDLFSIEAKIMLLTWLPDMQSLLETARMTVERWLEDQTAWEQVR